MNKYTFSLQFIERLTFSIISRFQGENDMSIIDYEKNKIEIMDQESKFNITIHEYKRCKTKAPIAFHLSNKNLDVKHIY